MWIAILKSHLDVKVVVPGQVARGKPENDEQQRLNVILVSVLNELETPECAVAQIPCNELVYPLRLFDFEARDDSKIDKGELVLRFVGLAR